MTAVGPEGEDGAGYGVGAQSQQPAATDAPRIEGERHVSAVAGRGSFSKKQGGILLVCATGAALAFVFLRPQEAHRDPNALPEDRLTVRSIARYEPPLPPPIIPAVMQVPVPPPALPPALPTQLPVMPGFQAQQAPADPLAKARRAALMAYSVNTGTNPAGAAGTAPGGPVVPASTGPNELAVKLQSTPLTGVTASVLRNQPYLLTQGNVVPCVLQTALDSTLPGFSTCIIPQDITGKTGITLLDRGTRIVGEFRGGMQQGESRLFVLWTRAETPNGVIINLDSPASDPLGRSGFDGDVDTHFWQRFGGALLLTVVQGAVQAGVAQASKEGTTSINTGNVDSVVAESLRGTVGIRPTLRKNQGELVSVFVARDLDFSSVYRVGLREGAP